MTTKKRIVTPPLNVRMASDTLLLGRNKAHKVNTYTGSARFPDPIRKRFRFALLIAFVAAVSPCVLALDDAATAIRSASRIRAENENTSPTIVTTVRPNPGQSALAADRQMNNQQVVHEMWTIQQGAPVSPFSMAQTADGFLWFCGASGLFRFDGRRFERFHPTPGDQLLSTSVGALFAPSTGGLWVGYTFGGFSFVNNGHVRNYADEGSSSTGSVLRFAQDSHGVMWAGTTSGVWRLEASIWRHLGAESSAPSEYSRLGFDRAGVLWVLAGFTKIKLFYLLPGSRRFQVSSQDPETNDFALDADRYVVTRPIGSQEASNFPTNHGPELHTYPILRKDLGLMIIDRNHSLWVWVDGSLLRVRISNLLKDLQAKGIARNSETYPVDVYRFVRLVDREGNVWFADEHGVHRFSYVPFTREKKFPPAVPAAMAAGDEGAVWIGLWGWGGGDNKLYRVTDKNIHALHVRGPLDWGFAYHAPDGTLWFGGTSGLWHLVDQKLIHVALPREMADQAAYLQAITADRTGGLWVSFGRHGLYRLVDGQWTSFGGRNDLPRTGVIIEFTDSLRRVWLGFTKNQVAVLDGEKVRVFGPEDGVQVGNVAAISGRGPGVWIGGEFGLQKFENGRFRIIQAVDEDWLLGISGIVETADGDLWLNGLSGIFHISRAEIDEALKNRSYRVRGEHMGNREGLPGFAVQVRPLPTAIEGSDGRIWFSLTGTGVVSLDPTRAQQKALVPPLTIQSVSADDKNYEINSSLTFPARTASVGIRYSAVSLSDPEAVRSRVKLRETDADWHEVSTGEPVTYRNLAPGHYHFSVTVSDTDGVWSDKVANVDFTILPAWYQTNWFRVLCVCTFLFLLWALYQARLKQLEHQFNVAIEARVNERTRIARDLHDTLLQSFQALLPHLQTVSNVLPSRPDEAKRRVDSAIDQATNAITDGRDTVHALRSGGSAATDLEQAISNFARELLSGASDLVPQIHVRFEGPPRSLNPVVRDEVYRIATEAIRNAVRHSNAGRIEVEIRYDEEQLRLRIGDDGGGIDPAILNQDHKIGHWGMQGMRERATLVGGTLEVWSQVEKGTEIELIIPAASVYARTLAARRFIFSRFWRS